MKSPILYNISDQRITLTIEWLQGLLFRGSCDYPLDHLTETPRFDSYPQGREGEGRGLIKTIAFTYVGLEYSYPMLLLGGMLH